MPKGSSPTVFVSSTCYDLSQTRRDLSDFISSLGLNPILSEYNSFPVNPDYDTVKNCIETVRNNTDIMVLIVGGRYGSQGDSERSVTNLEYLAALAKGLPIYVFVKSSILSIIPVWKNNKNGNYLDIVDTPKLFEFVDSLKSESERWIFSFESAQDITATLRKQFSYLFMNCLELRGKIRDVPFGREFQGLSPRALELLIQKPIAWEYGLFIQVLKDNIDALQDLRYDLEYGINLSPVIKINDLAQLFSWISEQSHVILNTISSLTQLLNSGLTVAVGPPGEPGDPKHIVYVARRISDSYKRLIDWRLEHRRIVADDDFVKLIDLCSNMATNSIGEIQVFVDSAYAEINRAIIEHAIDSSPVKIALSLTLTVPDLKAYYTEVERLKKKYKF
jgi:hypothetical protein